ncbi:hypothetical protein QWE_11376 [Agrobacterium albertimagni AOL15]|uniref:Uncharacterized protein n=1 Tax=Agrobacterium albertimagni AOL15 TaxID=1156935 RepID=K2QEG1_9HYPH|nr:hypothetical protein [Agrobacterium albertimagni]EKF59396.1 hypothetical protein QWE_11376 [Agrobacterium albertimagni AOL15]
MTSNKLFVNLADLPENVRAAVEAPMSPEAAAWMDAEARRLEAEGQTVLGWPTDDDLRKLVNQTPFQVLGDSIVQQDGQGNVFEVFNGNRPDTRSFLLRWIEDNGK